jgi:hypothetical protein
MMRIGVDFDNTLISYDAVFHATATRLGLIGEGIAPRKQAVRDAIRLAPDGELAWQKLQGQVYGAGIADATLIDGVDAFLRRCRAEACEVVIVSHKTVFGHHDPQRINLRDAALDWMKARKFFADDGYGISNVFFEATRAEKLSRIGALACDWFIDDLEEVFSDPAFPPGVRRILFAPAADAAASGIVCSTWKRIEERVFGD